MVSIPPFLTSIIKDLSLNYSQTGAVLGAWQLAYVAVAFSAGILMDRVRVKDSLTLGITLISISVALRGAATSFETMLVAVAIFGVGGPLISIGLPKLVAACFSGKERGTAVGIYVTGITAGSAVSLAVANSILLPLAGTWRKALYVYALFGVIVLMIWVLAGREPACLSERKKSQRPSTFKTMSALLKNRDVWLTIIIGFSGFFLINGLRNWLPTILESRGMTPAVSGWIASIYAITSIPASLVMSRLSYHVTSRKRLLVPMLLLGGISLLPTRFDSSPFSLISLVINGFMCGGVFSIVLVYLMELPEVGPAYMGGAVGMLYTLGEMGGFVAPALIGYLRDSTGSFLVGIDILIFVVEAMVPVAFLLRERRSSD